MTNVLLLLAFLVGALLAVFVFQNTDPVNVAFLGYNTGTAPLAAVILVSAAFGALLAFLLGLRGRVHRSIETRRTNRRIRDLEAEVQSLRATRPTAASTPTFKPTSATQPSDSARPTDPAAPTQPL